MLPKGTLIRVKDRPLKVDGKHNDGPLWAVRNPRFYEDPNGVAAYRCTALATGTNWTWFTDEFDVTGEEEQTDGDTDNHCLP